MHCASGVIGKRSGLKIRRAIVSMAVFGCSGSLNTADLVGQSVAKSCASVCAMHSGAPGMALIGHWVGCGEGRS